MNEALGKDYTEHHVFTQLAVYATFYKDLSYQIMGFVTQGTTALLNLDTYIYSSMTGTLQSIRNILLNGRINDAYALLRKYYDATIINVYSNLYLSDHYGIDNFIVTKIQDWITGAERIPDYRIMSQYIKASPKLRAITDVLKKDKTYKEIRDRCNEHTHYNFYKNILLNDNEIYNPERVKFLDIFLSDLDAVFIQHLAYIFFLNDHYLMSSDYSDSLDIGQNPAEDSQYWVAPFIQEIFDNVIKTKRPDIAAEIKNVTSMKLK